MVPSFFRPLTRQAWGGPRMDVAETESPYELAVELAGVAKDALEVGVYENSVTITAEVSEPKADGEQRWLVR